MRRLGCNYTYHVHFILMRNLFNKQRRQKAKRLKCVRKTRNNAILMRETVLRETRRNKNVACWFHKTILIKKSNLESYETYLFFLYRINIHQRYKIEKFSDDNLFINYSVLSFFLLLFFCCQNYFCLYLITFESDIKLNSMYHKVEIMQQIALFSFFY